MIDSINQLNIGFAGENTSELIVPEVSVSFSPEEKGIKSPSFTNSRDVANYIRSTYEKGEIGLQERFNILF